MTPCDEIKDAVIRIVIGFVRIWMRFDVLMYGNNQTGPSWETHPKAVTICEFT